MALTNRQTNYTLSADDTTIAITDGVGNNRIVIGIVQERRTPPSLSTSFLLDGTYAPSGVIINPATGDRETAVVYWLDSNMPASGGTYNVTTTSSVTTNCVAAAISYSGAKQAAPANAQSVDVTQSNTSFSISADSGSEYWLSVMVGATTVTAGCGNDVIPTGTSQNSNGRYVGYDTSGDGTVSCTHNSGITQAIAFAVEPFSSATSTPYISLTPQRNVRHTGRY